MSKFAIDLKNYPFLFDLFEKDKQSFSGYVQNLLKNAENFNKYTSFYHKYSHYDVMADKVFGKTANELIQIFLDAFFDYKGIVLNHPKEHEQALLEYLEHENNPLSLFTGNALVRNSEGEAITLQEFTGKEMDFKEFLQGLLYASRYLNHKEYVQAITLNRFDLVEAEKMGHFEQLMKIQPALEYQKINKLVVGARKEGTAFFDCGSSDTNECPITKKEMLESDDGYYSLDVLAYFSK